MPCGDVGIAGAVDGANRIAPGMTGGVALATGIATGGRVVAPALAAGFAPGMPAKVGVPTMGGDGWNGSWGKATGIENSPVMRP